MISIVCVYNNLEVLNERLLPSLQRQTEEFELILLDNTSSKYHSAASALNQGGSEAKGRYILFIHQDMVLTSERWLEEAEAILEGLPLLGAAGLAGIRDKKRVYSNIDHGLERKPVGNMKLTEPLTMQTLDECAVFVPRDVFHKNRFDEQNMVGWHLYAVDYCLDVIKSGLKVYVLPLHAWHCSDGASMSLDHFSLLRRLWRKHGSDNKTIHTTMGIWKRSFPTMVYECICLFSLTKKGINEQGFKNYKDKALSDLRTCLGHLIIR